LTSNIQTRAASSYLKHPIKFYYDFGLRISINTDNRLISNTTVSRELGLAVKYAVLNINDVKTIIVSGFKSAFLPMREKALMLNLVNNELGKY
jgi:adenosine deaminase